MKRLPAFALCFLIAAALLPAGWAFADAPVASAASVKQGAWAVREGKKNTLQPQAPVFVKDTLATDGSGKLELKFSDGTVIAMNPSTEAKVSDFVMSDTKNSFGASVTKGVSRVITGTLVKRNPIGFKVNTPRSTVGIRGTEVMFVVQNNNEIISVMHMNSEYVSVIDNQSAQAFSLTAPNQSVVMRQNQPAQVINNSSELTALLAGLAQSGSELTPQTLSSLLGAAANSPVLTTGSLPAAQQPAVQTSVNNNSPAALHDAIVLGNGSDSNRNTDSDRNTSTGTTPQTRCD